jgi:hypothetical protein
MQSGKLSIAQPAIHWANLSKARMQAWSGVYKAARHTNADKKLKERNKVALVIFRARVPLRRNNKIDACFLLLRRWWEKNFHCEINLIVFARSSGSNVHEQVRVRRAEKNKRSLFGRESPRESSAGRPTNAPRVECAINKRVFANWASKCGKRGGSSAATNGRRTAAVLKVRIVGSNWGGFWENFCRFRAAVGEFGISIKRAASLMKMESLFCVFYHPDWLFFVEVRFRDKKWLI